MSDLVKNKNVLEDFFGYFPSFHDDEILSVVMDNRDPSIEFKILSREWTNQLDEQGQLVFGKQAIVTLRCNHVVDMKLEGLSTANLIYEISFDPHPKGVEIYLEASSGICGSIVSEEVIIDSVVEIKNP